MKTIWIFLVEFLQNIVNKILIFLEITLSKRRLPHLPRPHATGVLVINASFEKIYWKFVEMKILPDKSEEKVTL